MKKAAVLKLFLGVALLGFTSCGGNLLPPTENPKNSKGPEKERSLPESPSVPKPDLSLEKLSPIELLQADLEHLRSTPHDGFQIYDEANGGRFAQVFGGTTTEALMKFLGERLRHFVDPNDPTMFPRYEMPKQADDPKKKGRVGAANFGVSLWLLSVIRRTPVTFHYQGKSVPVDSSRVGIMLIGEGYTAVEKSPSGKSVVIPHEYRQSMLLHEARHSDCTGGISESFLELLRRAPTDEKGESILSGIACGHLHVRCPKGHSLEGEPACDTETWGAYGVGAEFYRGVIKDTNISSLNFNIAQMAIADLQSRILVDPAADPGTPDMSSSGIIP